MRFFNFTSYYAIPPDMKTSKCNWSSVYWVYCVRSKWLKDLPAFSDWGCCWKSGDDCNWPSSPCQHVTETLSDRFISILSGQVHGFLPNHCLESLDPNPGWCCSRHRWERQRRHIAMMLHPPNDDCLHVFTIHGQYINKTELCIWGRGFKRKCLNPEPPQRKMSIHSSAGCTQVYEWPSTPSSSDQPLVLKAKLVFKALPWTGAISICPGDGTASTTNGMDLSKNYCKNRDLWI